MTKTILQVLSIYLLLLSNLACSQQSKQKNDSIAERKELESTTRKKMKVEIWSDIMCPFCYIGKRNYEAALKQFSDKDSIEIEWHSFQLDPSIQKTEGKEENVIEYLAKRKGISYEQSAKMHQNVIEMAKSVGLNYNFEIAKLANSFDAHRMIQLAKTKGLGDEAEEILFKAYFIEGKDFGNHNVLISLGKQIGLTEEEVKKSLSEDIYAKMVNDDIQEADSLGISGVPFFVFNRKYAVSGAQPPSVFLETLTKSYGEWKKVKADTILQVNEGAVCKPNEECK